MTSDQLVAREPSPVMIPVHHIDSAVVSRRSGDSYDPMYRMHRYWSRKSPDVVAAYIDAYTQKGDIVLDFFCGGGVVAGEACRLGRRAIAIDINPMATFITKGMLEPVALHQLLSGFEKVRQQSEATIRELYSTKCVHCGRESTVDFVIWRDDSPQRIAYSCDCSRERLFRAVSRRDRTYIHSLESRPFPFWIPEGVPLPEIQKERFHFVHELFTRRNLIALSVILHAIQELPAGTTQNLLRLAFTSALDKCSRLKPVPPSALDENRKPSLSMSWAAPRFYAPPIAQEVNPWNAFCSAFRRLFEGKKRSNTMPPITIGDNVQSLLSGECELVILTGSADQVLRDMIPRRSVDYVLTDPPYGEHIRYGALSTFWAAWLGHVVDYENEIVAVRGQPATRECYFRGMESVLAAARHALKADTYHHFFYHDVRGGYFTKFMEILSRTGFSPEKVVYQPSVKHFGYATWEGSGHSGDYVIRTHCSGATAKHTPARPVVGLLKKIAALAKRALEIREGSASVGTVLHLVYQGLDGQELLEVLSQQPLNLLEEAVSAFASLDKNTLRLSGECDRENPLRSTIRTALLDAYSMFGGAHDNKNRAYQTVLRRLAQDGITVDDIRSVDAKNHFGDLTTHRRRRYEALLRRCGNTLGYKASILRSKPGTVRWRKNDNDNKICCEFQGLDTPTVTLRVPHNGSGRRKEAEWGQIAFQDLERVMGKWSKEIAAVREAIGASLNPLEEEDVAPARSTSPQRLSLPIKENRPLLCQGYYLLELKIPRGIKLEVYPGQFFHISCDPPAHGEGKSEPDGSTLPLTLRRPFSVHRIHYAGFDRSLLKASSEIPRELREAILRRVYQVDFLYKVVGEGTRRLSSMRRGDTLDVLGPLGRSFKPCREKVAVIVGGGVGIAPLVALAERLRYADVEVRVYVGALTEQQLRITVRPDSLVHRSFADGTPGFADVVTSQFVEIGASRVVICTDDGSVGEHGRVPDVLAKDIQSGELPSENIHFYTCGPTPMMQSVSEMAARIRAGCEVLLEERMACGIGACWSCVCRKTDKDGKTQVARVCVDGPVFEASSVCW